MASLLSYRGRIGRAAFALGFLGAAILVGVVNGAMFGSLPDTTVGVALKIGVGGPVALGWFYWAFRCIILRIHDLGYRAWTVLALGVPILQFIFAGMLLLLKGDAGSNDYGNDPTDLPILDQLQTPPSERSPDYRKVAPVAGEGGAGVLNLR